MARLSAILALLSALILAVSCEFTNLPTVPQGVFNVSACIEINGTAAAAWDAICDLPSYPDWNPFVRYAAAVSPLNLTEPVQRPVEGGNLFFRVQIPPLPLPVNKDTPDNPLHTQHSYENVTHVQPDLGRVAWAYVSPDLLLSAERWSAVTDVGDGIVLYESREVYSGLLAKSLEKLLGQSLQASFEAQAKGLKLLLES